MGVKHTAPGISINIQSGGYVDFNQGVSFSNNDGNLKPMAFDEMFSNSEIVAAVNAFLSEFYPSGTTPPSPLYTSTASNFAVAPIGYSFCGLNIFGRYAMVLIPNPLIPPGIVDAASSTYTCTPCTGGGCTLDSAGFGAVHYCKSASCTGPCTLTISGIASNNVVYLSYNF